MSYRPIGALVGIGAMQRVMHWIHVAFVIIFLIEKLLLLSSSGIFFHAYVMSYVSTKGNQPLFTWELLS